jgi:hypothetical protein
MWPDCAILAIPMADFAGFFGINQSDRGDFFCFSGNVILNVVKDLLLLPSG